MALERDRSLAAAAFLSVVFSLSFHSRLLFAVARHCGVFTSAGWCTARALVSRKGREEEELKKGEAGRGSCFFDASSRKRARATLLLSLFSPSIALALFNLPFFSSPGRAPRKQLLSHSTLSKPTISNNRNVTLQQRSTAAEHRRRRRLRRRRAPMPRPRPRLGPPQPALRRQPKARRPFRRIPPPPSLPPSS